MYQVSIEVKQSPSSGIYPAVDSLYVKDQSSWHEAQWTVTSTVPCALGWYSQAIIKLDW